MGITGNSNHHPLEGKEARQTLMSNPHSETLLGNSSHKSRGVQSLTLWCYKFHGSLLSLEMSDPQRVELESRYPLPYLNSGFFFFFFSCRMLARALTPLWLRILLFKIRNLHNLLSKIWHVDDSGYISLFPTRGTIRGCCGRHVATIWE